MRSLLTPERLAGRPDIRVHVGDPAPAELPVLIGGATQILNGHTAMPAAVLEALPDLRRIVFLGTGASSYIDLPPAERLGIEVRTVRGYGGRSVAEHAMALLFAAARRIAEQDAACRAGLWEPLEGMQLQGRTIGVIGCGGIGAEMIRLSAASGMEVLCWRRSAPPPHLPCRSVSLDALLARSDAVSLHLALTPETAGFLNAARLGAMKPGAILVNTARGALVDEAALVGALASGHLGHAALDVFAEEPLPASSPLLTFPRTTLTPHSAYKTQAASIRLPELGLDLLIDRSKEKT